MKQGKKEGYKDVYIRYSGKVQQMILKWVCECVCEGILPQTKTLYCSGSIWNESPSIHYRLSRCVYHHVCTQDK